MNTLVLCPPELEERVFPAFVLEKIAAHSSHWGGVVDPGDWKKKADALAQSEVILSTWGMPRLDPDFLSQAPNLKAVLYAAGSVKNFVTEASWARGILISSAWTANAIPVAEFTLGAILMSLKRVWHISALMRTEIATQDSLRLPGAYRSKVGLVSLGAIGKKVASLLRSFETEVLVYDPFLSDSVANDLAVRKVALETLFQECDVVSIHAPWIPETERMITGNLIASMKPGATLINTARGAVIAEEEMIAVLQKRLDLSAVLDVTHPEPTPLDSPLRHLPHVILTPHIAGSMQGECARMGDWMAEELLRLTQGKPLQHAITKEALERMA